MGAVELLPASPASCTGPLDNDAVLPPVSEPRGGFNIASPIADVGLGVVGPLWDNETISGSGSFSRSSWIAHALVGNNLSIDGWTMTEAGAATVGTSSLAANANSFVLEQLAPIVATKTGSLFRIDPGGATFFLAASIDGVSDYVIATNSTRVEFYYKQAGVGGCPHPGLRCLVNRPFSVSYTDVFEGKWELDIESATWAP